VPVRIKRFVRVGDLDDVAQPDRALGRYLTGLLAVGVERHAGDTWPAATAAQPNTQFAAYKPVGGLPDDAVAVTPPDGETIEDVASKTKKLMAPPRADYRQVYAAGRAIASLPLVSQVPAIRAAVAQGGIYDFQRDPTEDCSTRPTLTLYRRTKAAAEAYALFYSSNYGPGSHCIG
jgi:hypothetical protein